MNKDKGIYFRATPDEQKTFKRRGMLALVRDLLALPYEQFVKIREAVRRARREE